MTDIHSKNKAAFEPFRQALYNFAPDTVKGEIENLFNGDATVHLSHPFETLDGPMSLFNDALMPLFEAFPDLERRDTIVMAGRSPLVSIGLAALDITPAHLKSHSSIFLQRAIKPRSASMNFTSLRMAKWWSFKPFGMFPN